MGRKTWDSIPEKFRPLRDRLNIIVSRSHPSTAAANAGGSPDFVKLDSLESVLRHLQASHQQQENGSGGVGSSTTSKAAGKVFVIGGGEIYAAALKLQEARRVLLTSVMDEFECDTHFPLALVSPSGEEEEKGGKGGKGAAEGWERQNKDALDAWTGEEVPNGIQEESGTRYEFQMWERRP